MCGIRVKLQLISDGVFDIVKMNKAGAEVMS